MQHKHGYRPEIDGLRSIAVLLVVFFHFGLSEVFEAGFVGVDIFFAISGYLIIPRIIDQLGKGQFRFADFYARRVRRLAPALLATIVLTLLAGLILLTPLELSSLAREALFSQVYASNIYYWRTLNYFGVSAESSFLLHTWSLAVEEQFYLVMPLCLWLVSRLRGRPFQAFLVAAFIASFALNLLCVTWKPEATFYLLPTRIWEFAAGGLVPALLRLRPFRRLPADLWALLGIGGLIVSLAIYRSDFAFPGIYALAPIAATVCFLASVEQGASLVGRLLSTPVPGYLGRISYEIYLVHWPLRVFGPMLFLDYTWGIRFGLTLASIALAAAIYHLVEAPIRTGRVLVTSRRLINAYAAATGLVIAAVVGMVVTGGVPSRLDPYALELQSAAGDEDTAYRNCNSLESPCTIGAPGKRPSWLVYGDSHADALAAAFGRSLAGQGVSALFAFQHGCLPVLNSGDRACRDFTAQLNAFLDRHPEVRHVTLVSTWRQPLEHGYTDANGVEVSGPAAIAAFRQSFEATIRVIQAHGATPVVWMPVPGARRGVPATLARDEMLGRQWNITIQRDEYDRTFGFLETALARHPNLWVIRPADAICRKGTCAITEDGRPLYRDDAHPAQSQVQFFGGIIAGDLSRR